jgi:ssDNA-binding Zn-finger/Zn-ribbon topoisomerase 1
MKNKNVYCPYCGSIAVLRKANEVYVNKIEDDDRLLLVCKNYPECDTYIKADENGNPKGVMANKELRHLRLVAHNYFDEIFRNNILSRSDAYKLLSDKLGIPLQDTHMSNFDEYRCKKTIAIAKNILQNHPKTREKYKKDGK